MKENAKKIAFAAAGVAVGFFVGSLLVNALSMYIPKSFGGQKA